MTSNELPTWFEKPNNPDEARYEGVGDWKMAGTHISVERLFNRVESIVTARHFQLRAGVLDLDVKSNRASCVGYDCGLHFLDSPEDSNHSTCWIRLSYLYDLVFQHLGTGCHIKLDPGRGWQHLTLEFKLRKENGLNMFIFLDGALIGVKFKRVEVGNYVSLESRGGGAEFRNVVFRSGTKETPGAIVEYIFSESPEPWHPVQHYLTPKTFRDSVRTLLQLYLSRNAACDATWNTLPPELVEYIIVSLWSVR